MGKPPRGREAVGVGVFDIIRRYATWDFLKSLVLDPAKLPLVGALIVAAEIVLNVLIVQRVPYTEIDWKAYMQECEGFLNGTLDYALLRGDTGPLVYPAGFVYIYSALYYLTDGGQHVRRAQYLFVLIYVLQLLAVLRIYIKSRKVPPYVLVLSTLTSYRIHSIYVLRLFNDPVAVLLFYISLNLFLDSRYNIASLFFSLAVSVKMNILLYAPVLLMFYLYNLGVKRTAVQLSLCAVVQLVLGLPFLLHSPVSYVRGSFDLGRVFNHTWTVNYRFLPIHTFESRCFHLTLLAVHVALLLLFYPLCSKYLSSYSRMRYVQGSMQRQIDAKNRELKEKTSSKRRKTVKREVEDLSPEQESFLKSFESSLKKSTGGRVEESKRAVVESDEPFYSVNFDSLSQLVILPMLLANFIGVVCARSLHYQFYSWYFHSLPYLLWCSSFSVPVRLLLLALLEMCWNTYPSTDITSALLHLCHFAILYGIYKKHVLQMKIAAKV